MELSRETRKELLESISTDELKEEIGRRNGPKHGDEIYSAREHGYCGLRLFYANCRGAEFGDVGGKKIGSAFIVWEDLKALGLDLVRVADEYGKK